MNRDLQQLIDDLGDAIHSSLSDSQRFAEVMAEMEESGYDAYVVLEASIGVSKKDASNPQSAAEVRVSARPKQHMSLDTELNASDLRFLRDLKISVG
jgi:hypothetical protein